MTIFIPRIVDLSHYESVEENGWQLAKDAGIWGVIHKCTQGVSYVDPVYTGHKAGAKAVGLLWGSYHFNDGSNVAAQVDYYLRHADPQPDELVSLDYEDNPHSDMGPAQMVEFLHGIEDKLGRKAVLYSGNKIKEHIGRLSAEDQAYVVSHRLWLAQYGTVAHLPAGWSQYWAWQFTGDSLGPLPHTIPGIKASTGLDLNVYDGDQASFQAEWAAATND